MTDDPVSIQLGAAVLATQHLSVQTSPRLVSLSQALQLTDLCTLAGRGGANNNNNNNNGGGGGANNNNNNNNGGRGGANNNNNNNNGEGRLP